MSNNEIPPYDIPFNGDDMNKDSSKKAEISANETDIPIINNNEDDFAVNIDDDIQAYNETVMPSKIDDTNDRSASLHDPKPKQSGGSIYALLGIVILLVVILAGSLVYIYADTLNIPFLSKKSSAKVDTLNISDNEASELDSLQDGEVSLSDEGTEGLSDEFSEDTGIEITRNRNVVSDNGMLPKETNETDMLALPNADNNVKDNQIASMRYYSGGNIGRLDPFNPRNGSGGELFEIIVPPIDPTPDTETQALMSLRISGIMFTPDSPSAIINIAGRDQLVRGGDKFDGFSVEKITKDKVTVRAGANIYTASVGEILNIEQVGINSIPNLGKKFAGPYTKGKDKIIEIKVD